ncbi:MAG TPA: 4-(cytidine 5'-diphospho)-2-C-methyl-D-erythritol kinase [Candidatus Binatia bacterium]|jgi:4-diphosphocytidyl-2-C-methyl-D-erythritol kinase
MSKLSKPRSATRQATVRAPAKVNLSLRVLAKRADGYHDIDSLMFAISLYDTVTVSVRAASRSSVSCSVSGPERVPGGRSNLAARAAVAVLAALGEKAAVSIRLRKEIPSGAGLGGGSSDAAAVIRVLPGLLGRRLPPREAVRIARSLGADVPFFLRCAPARATGIGDVLEPLPWKPAGVLVLAVPRERVNTAWAYRAALPRLTSRRSASRVTPFPRSSDAAEAWFFNDFQRGVERSFDTVRGARKALLGLGAERVVLSGSGSAVVGSFKDTRAAARACGQWQGPGQARLARVLLSAPRPVRCSPGNTRSASRQQVKTVKRVKRDA